MDNNDHMERLNNLFEKLKFNPNQANYAANKSKLKNVQNIIMRFYGEIDNIYSQKQNRIEMISSRLYKLQSSINQQMSKREVKQKNMITKVVKIQRNCRKNIQSFNKQRNEMDKKIQSNLDACLLEINVHKNKSQNQCNIAMKQILTLVPDIDELQHEVQNEGIVTKQILKKIYSQFSQQIQQLKQMIEQEKTQRQVQQEAIINRLEQTYINIHNNLISIKKSREKSEKMLVDLLERVIEKVKRELSG